MAKTGPVDITLSCGYLQAPWWGFLPYAGAALLQLGMREETVFRVILPLSGLLWTRVDGGRRRFFMVRPS